jgi:hypothetical protein
MDELLAFWHRVRDEGGPVLAAAWGWIERGALALHAAVKASPYAVEIAVAAAVLGWLLALVLWRRSRRLGRGLREGAATVAAMEARLASERRWREASERMERRAATPAA